MPIDLYPADSTLFRLINSGSANPVFDVVMPAITEVRNFYIPYAILFIVLLWKGGVKGRWCALLLALTVLIADPVSSRIIKETVLRVRPCTALDDVRILIGCGAGKSFPSSHAVNNFVAATIIGYFFRGALPYALAVAALVSFSRIYVGVHYPGDVLGGAVIGSAMAGIVLAVWYQIRRKLRSGGEV